MKRALLALGLVSAVSTVASADLIITELMYNPGSSPDDNFEYLEVYNSGSSPVDLAGYVVDDNANSFTEANVRAGSVPAHGSAVFITGGMLATMRTTWGASINFVELTGTIGMNNTGDKVGIWSSLSSYGAHNWATALDSVEYTNNAPWPGSGTSASIYLKGVTLDNSSAANWARSAPPTANAYTSAPAGDNSATNLGSPGIQPHETPPARVACCATNNTCSDLTSADCTAAGGRPQAAGSSCSTTPCGGGSGCPGDVNGDGTVNGSDIAGFVNLLLTRPACP